MKINPPCIPTMKLIHAVRRAALCYLLFLFVLHGATAPAHAQEQQRGNALSAEGAILISLAGTTLPAIAGFVNPRAFILVPSALLFGPMLGYVYAGETPAAVPRMLGRLAVMGGTVGAMYAVCGIGDCDTSDLESAVFVGVLGLGATAIMALGDCVHVGRHVRAKNEKLTVAPVYSFESGTLGLRAALRF